MASIVDGWQPRHLALLAILSNPRAAGEHMNGAVSKIGGLHTSLGEILGKLLPDWEWEQITQTWRELVDAQIVRDGRATQLGVCPACAPLSRRDRTKHNARREQEGVLSVLLSRTICGTMCTSAATAPHPLINRSPWFVLSAKARREETQRAKCSRSQPEIVSRCRSAFFVPRTCVSRLPVGQEHLLAQAPSVRQDVPRS
jgi:hypothetical protein